jgi:hypothetical protein
LIFTPTRNYRRFEEGELLICLRSELRFLTVGSKNSVVFNDFFCEFFGVISVGRATSSVK